VKILNAVQDVNRSQRHLFLEKIIRHFKGKVKGKKIAVWGLAFKPKTNDMRQAPSISIIEGLLKAGATVHAFDPIANNEAKRYFKGRISYFTNNYTALKGASALAILTEWNEFRRPDFARMRSLMNEHVIFDGRNIYEPDTFKTLGFTYYSVGRGVVNG
jgi:UDPglucose 6-dehydrogenase